MSSGGTPAAASAASAVVVVNYGSHELLATNLGGLDDVARIVVVDNWSSAAERAATQRLAAERGWEFVAVDGNRGFGGGVNLGVARAVEQGARELLLVNPDAVVSGDVARELAEQVRAHPDDVVAPRIVNSSGATWFAGSQLVLRTGFLREPPPGPRSGAAPDGSVCAWLTGACLAISASMFARVGGFADEYFLYWEDVELSFRAVQAGATLVVRHDLTVVHDEGGTHDAPAGPAKSPLYYRWNARNRLLFAARNLPTRVLLAWMVATPAQSWQILLRGGRRQLVQSPRPSLAIVAGSLAGIGLALREVLARAIGRGRYPS